MDDELDRNDLLSAQEEVKKLTSDQDRRDYFHRKHGNSKMADPAVNLSSFSWKPPGEEASDCGRGEKFQNVNRDDARKVSNFD